MDALEIIVTLIIIFIIAFAIYELWMELRPAPKGWRRVSEREYVRKDGTQVLHLKFKQKRDMSRGGVWVIWPHPKYNEQMYIGSYRYAYDAMIDADCILPY